MYPDGFGNLLRAGTVLAGSMHYFKEPGPGSGVWDESSIGFRFHPKGTDIKYKVTRSGIGRGGFGNMGFAIPPRHPAIELREFCRQRLPGGLAFGSLARALPHDGRRIRVVQQ